MDYYITEHKPKTLNCISISALIHVGILSMASLLGVNQLKSLPIGTTEGTLIEFAAFEAPKGAQTETQEVAQAAIATAPEPQAPLGEASSDEILVKKKAPAAKAKAPVAKKEIPKTLPTKVAQQTPIQEAAPIPDPVVVAEEKIEEKPFEPIAVEDLKIETSQQQLEVAAPAPKLDTPVENMEKGSSQSSLEQELQEAKVDARKALPVATNVAPGGKGNGGSPNGTGEQKKPVALVEGPKQVGELKQTNIPYGVAHGMRQLADLKQMPGNVPPSYDQKDRLHRREGVVKFQAMVTRGGVLTGFKMVQSSGHRELDLKTFAALKRWKFFPGQEGWVELPFKWSLKGGVEESPTFLRRGYSMNSGGR